MNRDADEYIRQRTGESKAGAFTERKRRVDLWVRDAVDKGYVESAPWVARLAKRLGVHSKVMPRIDLDEVEIHWVPGWFRSLVIRGDLEHAYHLIAPRHFSPDLEEMRLVVIECLFTGTVADGKREAYKYFLEITKSATSGGEG